MDVQLPDGTVLKDIPEGTSRSQIADRLQKAGRPVPADWLDAARPAAIDKVGRGPMNLTSALDIGAAAVTGGVGQMIGGIAKAGGYANKALGLPGPADPAAAGDKIAEDLTWSPKTAEGKRVMADISKGFQAYENWADKVSDENFQTVLKAGKRAAEVAQSLGAPKSVVDFIDKHKDELAAGYGSLTKTTLAAAPLVAGKVVGEGATSALKRPVGAVAGEGEIPAPRPAPGPNTVQTPPPGPQPINVPPPPTAAPGPAPGAARPAPGAPRPDPTAATPGSPRAKAQDYARTRLGLDWDALGAATQRKLETVAASADPAALERLNPEAVKRQSLLESLPVPIKTTAGKLTRDAPQLLREQAAAATDKGKPIRDTDIAANRDLRKNVEVLIDRLRGVGKSQAPVRAVGESREGVGEAVAGKSKETPGALTLKERKSQANYDRLYKAARATDPEARLPADAMYDFVRGEPDVLNPQTQHIGWMRNWLKKAGIEQETVDAEGNATTTRRPISAIELDDLRKLAGENVGRGGDSGHYAKQVLKAIDKTFDSLPDTAKAWKTARDAFRAHKAEFANQEAIARLVENKGDAFSTDPRTALEDVWKVSVKNAKLDQIRTLKRSLLSGPDAETRLAGKKALRELRAETARDMLREITKGVSTNEAGEANITADSINRWINSMGGEAKLEVVFGRRATNQLMKIREAAKIVKTEPTVRNVGSNTFQKILNWMDDSGLGKLAKSIGGGPVLHAAEAIHKAAETPRTLRAAGETATSAAERLGEKARAKRLEEIRRQQAPNGPPPTYEPRP